MLLVAAFVLASCACRNAAVTLVVFVALASGCLGFAAGFTKGKGRRGKAT